MQRRTGEDRQGIAAAILAGGRASRYGGVAKGLLEVRPGLSIIAREIRELQRAGLTEVAIVTSDCELYRGLGVPVVTDLTPGVGPLGGIEAGLAHYGERCAGCLFLPCDLPAISAAEIGRLVQAFATASQAVVVAVMPGGMLEPLCAVVHNGLRDVVSEALVRGERSVRRLWRQVGFATVHFADQAPFVNVNTPQDMARWRATRCRGSW